MDAGRKPNGRLKNRKRQRLPVLIAAAMAAAGLTLAEPGYAGAPINLSINGQIPTLAPIIKRVAPSVVSVSVRTQAKAPPATPFGSPRRCRGHQNACSSMWFATENI